MICLYNKRQLHTVADSNRDLMTELETLDNLTGQKHSYMYLEPNIMGVPLAQMYLHIELCRCAVQHNANAAYPACSMRPPSKACTAAIGACR